MTTNKSLSTVGKRWHFLILLGMLMATTFSSIPTLKTFASNNSNERLETTEANFLAARQALYFKDLRASANFYLAALNLDRNNANLLQQAFYTQYQLGNIDAAAALARDMEVLNITSRSASEPATAQAILMDDWDAVLVLADHIAENVHFQPVAAIIRAWALVAKGQGAAGLSHLLEAGRSNISGDESVSNIFVMQAARLAEYLGNYNEMLTLANQLSIRNDLSSQLIIQIASIYARHDENDKLEQLIVRLPNGFNKSNLQQNLKTQSSPKKIASHISAGIIDVSLVNPQLKANGMLNARLSLALYLDPQLDSANFLLAQALHEMGQKKRAVEQLSAIDAKGIWGQPRLLLQADINRNEDISIALSFLEGSVDKDKTNAFLQKELGDLYRISNSFIKARNAYLKATHLGLISADLDRNLGITFEQLGQDQLAENSFKDALQKNPKDPYTLNYLGYWWADDGRKLDEAIQLIEQAVRLRPRSGYFVDSLGWVHFKLGNLDLAVSFLEQATILEPTDPVINGHLGDAYWAIGRYQEARFKWQYALSIATEDDLKAEFFDKISQ
ncbi:tetratricopeptide repeat protein [Candidatus Puniceispirillum sp.]|nr:tetratricopeptide repeat protein [Candidatus Puniceispirillum sp.]